MATDRRPPVLCLAGPTASGKTELALRLCDRLPCEIVSVDSAMVYRGMDVGTAKPDPDTLARYPHRLVDIRDPAEPYSAADFCRDARAAIETIIAAGRIPLLVGGTMLYFRALLDGLADLPRADAAWRAQLAAEAASEGWPALHARLRAVDPETADRLHPHHSQRIQRALEVYHLTGRSLSVLQAESGGTPLADDYTVHAFALSVPRPVLHARIAERFQRMLETGLIEEARALCERGDLHPELPALRAVGYRQVRAWLAGECDYTAMIDKGIAATRQLAKRQITWLRRWNGLYWLDADLSDAPPAPAPVSRSGARRVGDGLPVDVILKVLTEAP